MLSTSIYPVPIMSQALGIQQMTKYGPFGGLHSAGSGEKISHANTAGCRAVMQWRKHLQKGEKAGSRAGARGRSSCDFRQGHQGEPSFYGT